MPDHKCATSDFSEDDADKVVTYLNNGGDLLVTTNSEVTENLNNFESILSAYGISRQKGMIAESETSMYYQNPFYLLPDVAGSVFTSGTSGAYIFAPYAEGLTVPEDTDEMTYIALLTTSDSAVLKVDVQNATSYAYEDGDTKGSFTLGVAAQKTIDEETVSTMVVYSSAVMFTDSADQMVSGNNSTLFASTLGQLTETDDDAAVSVVIPMKEYNVSLLTVPASSQIMLSISFVLLVPLVLVVAGVLIWIKRRKQ